jgi:hypothetical protein
MGKIQAENVGARFHQNEQSGSIGGRRTNRGDNLGASEDAGLHVISFRAAGPPAADRG